MVTNIAWKLIPESLTKQGWFLHTAAALAPAYQSFQMFQSNKKV